MSDIIEAAQQYVSWTLVLKGVCIGFVLLIICNIVDSVRLLPLLAHSVQQYENKVVAYDKVALTSHVQDRNSIRPLFGEYVPKNLNAADVQESMINFKVVGILYAEREEDSEVILQKPSGQEHFYHVGDKLPDDSLIKRITTEGVLILREGKLERLSLPKEGLQFDTVTKPIVLENED